MPFDPRHQSRALLDGADRAAARSYFRAVGFSDEDMARPLVGVAHCWIEITPCNFNHRKLAEKVFQPDFGRSRRISLEETRSATADLAEMIADQL